MVLMGIYYGVGHYSSKSDFFNVDVQRTNFGSESWRNSDNPEFWIQSGVVQRLPAYVIFCFVPLCANRHIESYMQANNKHVHLALPTYKWNVVNSNVTATRVPSSRAKWNAPSGSSSPLNCYFSIWLRLNLIAFL